MTRHPLLHVLALRSRADRETAERIAALVFLLLWAEFAASDVRHDHVAPWMDTGPAARTMRSLRPARRTTAGRRARG
jgi:hypothetical protein